MVVNGTEMPVTTLVGRASSLQRAFDRLKMHILDTIETPDRIVIALLLRGRHVGPFISPLGTVAPTQCDIEVRTIDVLTVSRHSLRDLGRLRRPRPASPGRYGQPGVMPGAGQTRGRGRRDSMQQE
jgi:hypothetical protein